MTLAAALTLVALATSHAQADARAYWQADPCAGNVIVGYGPTFRPTAEASAGWRLTDPFTECRITINPWRVRTWPHLCRTIVHEYGHLTGHEHSTDPSDVMYPVYRGPIGACRR